MKACAHICKDEPGKWKGGLEVRGKGLKGGVGKGETREGNDTES